MSLIFAEKRENHDDPLVKFPQTWEEFFSKNESLLRRIIQKVEPIEIPLPTNVFEAYHLTPLPCVRVVIIGQDPYPGRSNSTGLPFAQGLAFSYPKKEGVSSSMRKVNEEIKNCYPEVKINHSCLVSWAFQGVFLLNTALTLKMVNKKNVDIDEWKDFVGLTIQEILKINGDCIFVAWGDKAKNLLSKFSINNLLTAGHPSPLNTRNNFLGCDHFKKINDILTKKGERPIDWNLC